MKRRVTGHVLYILIILAIGISFSMLFAGASSHMEKLQVATAPATNISNTAITLNAKILSNSGSAIYEYGFYFGKNNKPVQKIKAGSAASDLTYNFNKAIYELEPGANYYFKAYARNSEGEALGETQTVSTLDAAVASVTSRPASNIEYTSAVLNAHIPADGYSEITEHGFYFGTTPDSLEKLKVGSAVRQNLFYLYVMPLGNLSPATTYYFKAYAVNEQGESQGQLLKFNTKNPVAPYVRTKEATNIEYLTATINGAILSNGYAEITEYGFYWGADMNDLHKVTLGTDDPFLPCELTFDLTGLTANTEYFFQVYAVNTAGEDAGDVLSFTTKPPVEPAVVTGDTTGIDYTTAKIYGTITGNGYTDITEYGFYWGTTATPSIKAAVSTTDPDIPFAHSAVLENLIAGRTYYYQIYAVNSAGEARGEIRSFKTKNPIAPAVTTKSASVVAYTSAVINGEITANGYADITEYGYYWGATAVPGTKVTLGTNNPAVPYAVSGTLEGLQAGKTYYFCTFAKNSAGETKGAVLSFTTKAPLPPAVTTKAAGAVDYTSAVVNGEITGNGYGDITEYGYYWGTTSVPGTKVTLGTNNPAVPYAVSGTLDGLQAGKTYYFCTFAKNSAGETKGAVLNFTTKAPVAPAVTAGNATAVGYTVGTLHGAITADGYADITEYGYYWGTGSDPTTKVILGTSVPLVPHSVSTVLNGLLEDTFYYYKFYAVNAAGYKTESEVLRFKTLVRSTLSTIKTDNYASAAATIGATIYSEGTYDIVEYGFYWGTTNTPATKLQTGTSVDTTPLYYSADLSGLLLHTTYYYKAYAINAKGEVIEGAVESFTTWQLGDVNQDGEINIQDVTEIDRYLQGQTILSDSQKKAADFNQDGYISQADIEAIQNYLV